MLTRWMLAAAANAGGAPPASLLLDTYTGAAAAFSVRKLRTAYSGACLRVRRSSDSAEQDIGFSGNDLDTTSLLSFCGAGNGFVVTWYDQSGNGNNATQSTATAQPQIVSSGSVITLGSKPAMTATSSQWLGIATIVEATASQSMSIWMTYRKSATGEQVVLGHTSIQYVWDDISTAHYFGSGATVIINNSMPVQANVNYLIGIVKDTNSSLAFYTNGATVGTASPANGTNSFSKLPSNVFRTATMTLQELVYYGSNQASNRTGIESNINTHYNIY